MNLSPLIIRMNYFETVNISASEIEVAEFERSLEPAVGIRFMDAGDMDVAVNVGFRKDDKNEWRVAVTVKSKEKKDRPFTILMKLIGYFHVHPKYLEKFPSEEERFVASSKLVTNAGASILYGSIREYLLTASSRFRTGPIMLRSVLFPPVVMKREEAIDVNTPGVHSAAEVKSSDSSSDLPVVPK